MCLRRKTQQGSKVQIKNKHNSTLQEEFSSFSRVAHHSQIMFGSLVSLALCSFLPVSSSSAPRTDAKVFGLRTLDAAVLQARTNGVHTQGGGRKERGLVLLRRWDGWVVGSQLLDGSFTVHTVVGLVVSHTVLFIQQVCCLVWQTIMQLRKSQFDFSVFTVRGLRCFVHPGCHQGILVLLS